MTPIRANIVGPPSVATRIRASIAACHSELGFFTLEIDQACGLPAVLSSGRKARLMRKSDTPDQGTTPAKQTAASTPPNGEDRRRIIEEYANPLREFREAIKAILRRLTH